MKTRYNQLRKQIITSIICLIFVIALFILAIVSISNGFFFGMHLSVCLFFVLLVNIGRLIELNDECNEFEKLIK